MITNVGQITGVHKIIQIKSPWHLQTGMVVSPKSKDKPQISCIKELPKTTVTRVCVCVVCFVHVRSWLQ